MVEKLLKKNAPDVPDEIEESWAQVSQILNASTEQLEISRTQSVMKMEMYIRKSFKMLRTIRNLVIAIFVLVLIITLLI